MSDEIILMSEWSDRVLSPTRYGDFDELVERIDYFGEDLGTLETFLKEEVKIVYGSGGRDRYVWRSTQNTSPSMNYILGRCDDMANDAQDIKTFLSLFNPAVTWEEELAWTSQSLADLLDAFHGPRPPAKFGKILLDEVVAARTFMKENGEYAERCICETAFRSLRRTKHKMPSVADFVAAYADAKKAWGKRRGYFTAFRVAEIQIRKAHQDLFPDQKPAPPEPKASTLPPIAAIDHPVPVPVASLGGALATVPAVEDEFDWG